MKRGGAGFKNAGGASFCHHCFRQLQAKAGGGFYFVELRTPHDGHPVRVHSTCEFAALTDGYWKVKAS